MRDTMLLEPSLDKLLRLVGGLDDLSDFLGAHVLAMAVVIRVRNLEQVLFDLAFVLLLEADLEVDGLVLGGGADSGPAAWDDMAFLDGVGGAGGALGEGLDGGEAANGEQQVGNEHAGQW